MGPENNSPRQGPLGRSLKKDLLASVVVFLVALPLCMGIALASGAPMAAGILTGIIGGIVVGTLAGSPLQVSGPAAGLTVVVLQIIQDDRLGLAMLGVIVLGAGLLQVAMGLMRMGQWFRAVSPAVIQGMLAGIGVLIFAGQFHVMVDDEPGKNGLVNLLTIPLAIWRGVEPFVHYLSGMPYRQGEKAHTEAAFVGLLTILALVAWKPLVPKKLSFIPGPLVAIVVATAVTAGMQLPILKVEMQGNLWEAVRFPTRETLLRVVEQPVLVGIVTVALIASAETLLCASAVDKLHRGPRTDYDRELTAQGVGNTCCGLVGALPMTGVIVRSAANVEAGGTSRASAILHGVWLLILVALAPGLLSLVPKAGLAAILVYTGFKLVNVKAIRSLWQTSRSEVLIYAATLSVIVARDLLVGVLVGVVLSAVKLLHQFSRLKVRVIRDKTNGRTTLYLRGAATFLRLPKLAAVLESVPPATELHVHFEDLRYIDHACLELLVQWEVQHRALGGTLVIDWDSLHARFDRSSTSSVDMDLPSGVFAESSGDGEMSVSPVGSRSGSPPD
jgi:MFS superfamily sulfate permease-like transporter